MGKGKHANKCVWKAHFPANLWFFTSSLPPPPPPQVFSSLSFHIPTKVGTSDELLNLTIFLLLLNFILAFVPSIHSSCSLSGLVTIHACNFSTVFSTFIQLWNTAKTCKPSSHLLHVHIFDSYAY